MLKQERQSLIYRNVEEALAELNAKDRGRYFICTCPECQHQEAFMYKNNITVIQCNRENECGERMILRYEEKQIDTPILKEQEKESKVVTRQQLEQWKKYSEIFTSLYLPAMTSDILEEGYRGLSRETTDGFVADFENSLMVKRMFEEAKNLFPKDYSTSKWMCERNIVFPIIGEHGMVDRILLRSTLNPTIQPKEIQLIVNPSGDARDFFVDVPEDAKKIVIGEALLDTLSFREIDKDVGIMALTGAAKTKKLCDYLIQHKEEWRGKEFLIAMDNDIAGRRATEKVKHVLQEIGLAPQVFSYPEERINDANQFLREDREAFESSYRVQMMSFLKNANREFWYER